MLECAKLQIRTVCCFQAMFQKKNLAQNAPNGSPRNFRNEMLATFCWLFLSTLFLLLIHSKKWFKIFFLNDHLLLINDDAVFSMFSISIPSRVTFGNGVDISLRLQLFCIIFNWNLTCEQVLHFCLLSCTFTVFKNNWVLMQRVLLLVS